MSEHDHRARTGRPATLADPAASGRGGAHAVDGRPGVGVTVVIMTRNRADELLVTLDRLSRLPGSPRIAVVDNRSDDGTVTRVTRYFPEVTLIALGENLGVEARNIAVRSATTPYVAFNDDDSWWAPGSLEHAVRLFGAHPRLGALSAHVVVEPDGRDDSISLEMRDSPLTGDPTIPGTPVLGFLACRHRGTA